MAVAGGVPTWTDTSNVGNWQRNLGAVSPTNITDDVLVGGISTASATFRVDSATGLITTASVNSATIVNGSVANADLTNSSVTVTAGTGMSGGGVVSLGGSVTLTNAGVTSAVGTSNQVNVSAATGGVTFSLPQSIATNSNVTFNNLSLGGNATVSGGLVLYGTPTIATTAKQSLTLGDSNTGNVVVTNNISAANLSGTNTGDQTITLTGDVTGSGTGSFATTIGALKVTNGMLAGSIAASKLVGTDIATVGTITTGNWNGTAIANANLANSSVTVTAGTGLSGGGAVALGSSVSLSLPTVTTGLGGTNITTYTTGDMLYASGTNTLAKRAIGTTGQVLAVSGGVPTWTDTSSVGNWQRNLGAVSPTNITDDVLAGGISTASATFRVDSASGLITTASVNSASIVNGSVANADLTNSSVTVTAGTGMSGGGAVSLGGSVTLTNAGVTSAVGTTNQVNVSAATGGVTFSLPQSIATNSNVTFNNLSLGGSATVSGGLVLYGTPTISTTAMQSLTLGDSNTGNINIPGLTASRGLFTNGSSSLTTTAASAALLNSLSDETGTGVVVFATSPTLTTPVLGVASATSINKVTLTTPATGSTLTIADGKTFTSSNTLTLSGTDGSSLNIGAGGTLGTGAYATIANYQTLLTNSSGLAGALNDETGTGLSVFATSPTLTTPVLGVASATSINKVTLTAPATGSTLTIADGKTLTSNATLTLAGTDSTTLTFQGTDTYIGRATTDTLTNKTWNGVAIGAIYGGTAQTTWTTGDILYASGTNTLAKLGIGSSTQVLTVTGGVPVWGAGASSSNWQRNSGAISPLNITDDLLIGAIATASAKFAVISGSGNLTTAGTITLPNTNVLTGVSGYTQFGAGISVGGGTTYYINTSGVANLAGTTVSALTNSGATTLTGALTAQSTASVSGALTSMALPPLRQPPNNL